MSQKKKKKKVNSKLIIAEAVVVAALALGGWGYFSWKNAQEYVNEQDAIQINGEQYSVSDVNYFFYTYYDTFRQQNAEYLSYMIDDSKPLKEQEYENGQSWFDYLLDESVDSMVHVVTVAEAAEKRIPHRVTNYIYDLASALHSFYNAEKVIDPENEEKSRARLALMKATQITLNNALQLIGVSAPEKM